MFPFTPPIIQGLSLPSFKAEYKISLLNVLPKIVVNGYPKSTGVVVAGIVILFKIIGSLPILANISGHLSPPIPAFIVVIPLNFSITLGYDVFVPSGELSSPPAPYVKLSP